MKISDIRVRLVKNDSSRIKANVSLTIEDCFVVHDIKVIELNNNEGFFVAMPGRKDSEGKFKDIVHPINTETREQINEVVLKAFEEAKKAEENA